MRFTWSADVTKTLSLPWGPIDVRNRLRRSVRFSEEEMKGMISILFRNFLKLNLYFSSITFSTVLKCDDNYIKHSLEHLNFIVVRHKLGKHVFCERKDRQNFRFSNFFRKLWNLKQTEIFFIWLLRILINKTILAINSAIIQIHIETKWYVESLL